MDWTIQTPKSQGRQLPLLPRQRRWPKQSVVCLPLSPGAPPAAPFTQTSPEILLFGFRGSLPVQQVSTPTRPPPVACIYITVLGDKA